MKSETTEQQVRAFRKIHSEFERVVAQDKCRSCSCFHEDVLARVRDHLARFNRRHPDHRLDAIQADFARWADDRETLKTHG